MTDAGTPSNTPDELEFRPMSSSESDLRLFHDCFSANGSPRSMEMLRWQYFDHAAGPLLVDFALTPEPDRRLAAIYAVAPVIMRAGATKVLGVQSLNTLTDEAYRGRGLFVQMAKSLFARATNAGTALVYGFPNGNSAHGFFKRLEWTSFDPMPVLIHPLRTGYVLRKIGARALAGVLDFPMSFKRRPKLPPRFTLRTLPAIGAEFDAVWDAFAATIGYGVERTAMYLAWRLRRPGESYECIGLYEGDKPLGFAITGVTRVDGQIVGKLMELVFDPALADAGRWLASEVMYRLYQQGAGVVWTWCFEHAPNFAAIRHAGFFALPAGRTAHELHGGARSFAGRTDIGDRSQWYVSMLDSDSD
jgi:hypothetical protein